MSLYHPPFNERTTEDLLSIIENVDDWKEDALIQVRKELQLRGYSLSQQKRREQSTLHFRQKVKEIKAEATYTTLGLWTIYILAPVLSAISFRYSFGFYETWELKSEGYEKKWKQCLSMILLGNLTWLIIFMIFY